MGLMETDGVVSLGTEAVECNDLGALMTDPQDYSFDNISDMPFTNLLSEQIVKR